MPRAALAAAIVALVAAAPSGAHTIPSPSFVEAGRVGQIALSGPNERDEPMTGFRLRVPSDLRIVSAHGPDGWRADVRETEATWSGGSLPPAAEATFHVELEAPSEPGPALLETEQLYSGGEVVRWPVHLTVVPAADAPGQHLGRALAVALVGVLVVVAVAALAWHRRTRSLQER